MVFGFMFGNTWKNENHAKDPHGSRPISVVQGLHSSVVEGLHSSVVEGLHSSVVEGLHSSVVEGLHSSVSSSKGPL